MEARSKRVGITKNVQNNQGIGGCLNRKSTHDHVHLLIEYPPKMAVAMLVNSLKGVSSRLLRKQRPDIEKRYWKNMLWSPSYFAASCGGAPISIIKQYVEQQQTPD